MAATPVYPSGQERSGRPARPPRRTAREKRSMTAQRRITFGFQAAPTSDLHEPDRVLYDEVLEDCALGHRRGYDAAWMLEHHFSDYYPTPSPHRAPNPGPRRDAPGTRWRR